MKHKIPLRIGFLYESKILDRALLAKGLRVRTHFGNGVEIEHLQEECSGKTYGFMQWQDEMLFTIAELQSTGIFK